MSNATRDQVFAVLTNIEAICAGIRTRMKYQAGTDDPYPGVMVNAYLNGQHTGREPFGPFKSPEDARDYLEAKRRAHGPKTSRKYGTAWLPEHDGQLFCHPGFTYQLIHTREFYASAANAIVQAGQAMLMSAVAGPRPDALPLEPVPRIEVLRLASNEGNLIEQKAKPALPELPFDGDAA